MADFHTWVTPKPTPLSVPPRAVTESINQLIMLCTQQAPGQKECDNALRELEVSVLEGYGDGNSARAATWATSSLNGGWHVSLLSMLASLLGWRS